MRIIISFLILATSLLAQFRSGTYNYVFNLKDDSALEFTHPTNPDAVDDMFAGLLGQKKGAQPAGFKANGAFMANDEQKFIISDAGDGYNYITSVFGQWALTVENSSTGDDAKIVAEKYSGKDNQKIKIVRDTAKYRYASFFVFKHSGKALTMLKNRELVQQTIKADTPEQVWGVAYRNVLLNENAKLYMGIEKGAFSKLHGSGKNNISSSWNLIVHPTGSGIYYIQNTATKMFMCTPQDEAGNGIFTTGEVMQVPYRRTGYSMLYVFRSAPEGQKGSMLVPYNTDDKWALTIEPGTGIIQFKEKTGAPDQLWKLFNAKMSLW